MAFEIPGLTIPREASTDLSASQFCGVTIDANGRVALAGAGNAFVAGVLQNKPAALGAEASVMVDGVTKMVAGAAVTMGGATGGAVKVDSTGRAINSASTDKSIGIALTAAAAANELISVLLVRFTS